MQNDFPIFSKVKRFIAAVVLFAVAALLPACSKTEEKGVTEPVSEPFAEVNRSAPAFTLNDFSGIPMKLSDHAGKVVMLEFFTSWCLPCQIVAPDIAKIYAKYKNRGFIVLAISLKDDFDTKALQSFITKYSVTYPVLIDDNRTSKIYGVFSMPTTFLIDREGKIRKKHLGIVDDYATFLSKEIEALL